MIIKSSIFISQFIKNWNIIRKVYINNNGYYHILRPIIIRYNGKIHHYEIKNYLSIRGLTVNNDKEFYYNPKDKIEFLGFSYQDGIIDVSDNSFKKMKGKIKRSAKGLRRWMIRKNASSEATLKAMNRKFNCKFYGKNENDRNNR